VPIACLFLEPGAARRCHPPTWDSQVDIFQDHACPLRGKAERTTASMEAGVSQNEMLFWLTPASMLAVVLSALPGAGLAVRFLVHLGLRSRATRLGIPILVARLA
jgi:hypothetical protein